MGWFIRNLKNEVELSEEQALTLIRHDDFFYHMTGGLRNKNEPIDEETLLDELFEPHPHGYQLLFDSNQMEHMDYVWQIIEELKSFKVKGDITFSSLEGDNGNTHWGYSFDGNGNMSELIGEVNLVKC